jgi:predicted GNAT family acetyltransferase
MTYSRAGDKLMIIDHTEISDTLQGKGVGRKLLQNAVDFARTNEIKILPLCPYAKSVFDKDPTIRDVLR